MLDRDKIVVALSNVRERLFPNTGQTLSIARDIWNKICADPTFAYRLQSAEDPVLVPGWEGKLDGVSSISNLNDSYSICAFDGSQIYPDRNVPGGGCFLINVGGINVSYGFSSSVTFINQPYLFLPDEAERGSFSKDFVDLKREEFELRDMFVYAQQQKNKPVCLCDGSLIFWHIESKALQMRDQFLSAYLYYLEEFYKSSLSVAGYISAPRSRELVNLLTFEMCEGDRHYSDDFINAVDGLCDTSIVRFFLKPHQRTNLFCSNAKIVESYPNHLRPFFFYLHCGDEIGRVEIPAWISNDAELVDTISRVILDQCIKGRGYPVCLAEAHEQAVVKGGDRDFFYSVITKMGIEENRRVQISQKSAKKRRMNI